ncbi:MAG: bifunctional phosphopantothenoylcysteine decarboxylase/phosphopantothenate--cysteine ligase CoaBC [Pseudomonadota bacterium]
MSLDLSGRRVLLIVSGGIAAYKALELIRLIKGSGGDVRCVLTAGGAQFVTPLSLAALSEDDVYGELFSLTDEARMGHIELSRDADLLVVVPASADILAKMASGQADDLATTVLLATDKPVLAAPAMNVRMWHHAATQANLATLTERGVRIVGPGEGAMACGEFGLGRLAEPMEILAAIGAMLGGGPLKGKKALVTSGPTHEPIDPVRYIANRSSGRQGHAIAAALAAAGAETILVSGPTDLSDPPGLATVPVETATQMLAACQDALPVDLAVCAAAVADWRVADRANQKLKKTADEDAPALRMTENPDILATLSQPGAQRPDLVIGFAAETESVLDNARAKLARKGCDWILANDVSPGTGTFGGDSNQVSLITRDQTQGDTWPSMSKGQVAERLVDRIVHHFAQQTG